MTKLKNFLLTIACLFFPAAGTCLAGEFIIDVRTPEEYAAGHVENSLNIPYNEIVEGVTANDIKREDTIYLYCLSGKRAERARSALTDSGYAKVINLGGYDSAAIYFEKNPVR